MILVAAGYKPRCTDRLLAHVPSYSLRVRSCKPAQLYLSFGRHHVLGLEIANFGFAVRSRMMSPRTKVPDLRALSAISPFPLSPEQPVIFADVRY
jgi:hypothetical protein